jgi:hypothetical protein
MVNISLAVSQNHDYPGTSQMQVPTSHTQEKGNVQDVYTLGDVSLARYTKGSATRTGGYDVVYRVGVSHHLSGQDWGSSD